jgi:predicted Zn finger-like uncharacterized protein
MSEPMMRVLCPQCGAAYRVNADAVPPEGATAACKKCSCRFAVRKPGSDGAAKAAPAAAEPPRESVFTCPACGRQQTQPYNCYACGAVITPRESAPAAPAVADAATPATGVASAFGIGMAEIVVRARFNPSDWILNFAEPCVSIDGMEHHQGWGAHAFQVPEGDCQVVIDYNFFMGHRGRVALPIHAATGEKVYIDYSPQGASGSAPGTARRASTPEGLLWRIEAKSDRPEGKGLYSRKAVIISLIVLGPLGLYQLWKSEAFSIQVKIIITVVEVILMAWLFSKFMMPVGQPPLQ